MTSSDAQPKFRGQIVDSTQGLNQKMYDPNLFAKRLEDAGKYLQTPEYRTKYFEAFMIDANKLFEMFEAEEGGWKVYFEKYKPAVEAFLSVMQSPVTPESLIHLKELLGGGETTFNPNIHATRKSDDINSMANPIEEKFPVNRGDVKIEPTSNDRHQE